MKRNWTSAAVVLALSAAVAGAGWAAFAGNGSQNPNKVQLIRGFKLSSQERTDLIPFLRSLSDEEVIHDPRFGHPRQ